MRQSDGQSDVQSELKKMVYKDGIFNVMDKAFSIAIDSRSRILKQCNGWPSKPLPQFALLVMQIETPYP